LVVSVSISEVVRGVDRRCGHDRGECRVQVEVFGDGVPDELAGQFIGKPAAFGTIGHRQPQQLVYDATVIAGEHSDHLL
jgi:hypothetical protein